MSRPSLARCVLPLALALAACNTPSPSHTAQQKTEPYTLVFLVAGASREGRPPNEQADIQRAHLANINELARQKKLLTAGPFGQQRPAPEVRGIFVLDTAKIDEARAWTDTDPAVKAGVLAMELCPFTTASRIRTALDAEQRAKDAAAKEGRELRMEETIRGYTMILAQDATRAEHALAPVRAQGHIVFEGRLADCKRGSYVAVLDAADVAGAEKLLGNARAELGKHQLAAWWSARSLAEIAVAPR